MTAAQVRGSGTGMLNAPLPYKYLAVAALAVSVSVLAPFFRMLSVDYSQLVPPQAAPEWKHSAAEIESGIDAIIAGHKQLFDTIGALEHPSAALVVVAALEWENVNGGVGNALDFYQYVHDDKAKRDALVAALEKYLQYLIEAANRDDVYKAYAAVAADAAEVATLTPEQQRLLKHTMDNYKQRGFHLSPEERNKAMEMRKELTVLELQFGKNQNEDVTFLLFTREELEGVPELTLATFAEVEDNGVAKLKMTYKYPDYVPVMEYAQRGATRRKAFVGSQLRLPANEVLFQKQVVLRAKLAEQLGYSLYAQLVLEDRMAKVPENVDLFLDGLREKLTAGGKTEVERLYALKQQHLAERGEPAEPELYSWDFLFYHNLFVQQQFQVDHTKLSEYFALGPTLEKVLGLYETLFGLKFVEVTSDKQVWHADVLQYAVWKTDALPLLFVGYIYLDLHPRDGKYLHAANFGLFPGYIGADVVRVYPATALVCNFTKPNKDRPLLLKHSEAVTLLHEFGHGIHNLVATTELATHHGTEVARDFVEAPLQMLEYWMWLPRELKNITSHYQTGEPVDDALIERLIATKHVNGASSNLRQLHFGLFDFTLHSKGAAATAELDLDDLWTGLRLRLTHMGVDGEVGRGYSLFGHLGTGGYVCGYYGYLYLQVFAADMYYTLFKADPMNSTNGKRYRDIVLGRGGSKDALDLLQELLGREPTNQAFLEELGILAAPTPLL